MAVHCSLLARSTHARALSRPRGSSGSLQKAGADGIRAAYMGSQSRFRGCKRGGVARCGCVLWIPRHPRPGILDVLGALRKRMEEKTASIGSGICGVETFSLELEAAE